VLQLTESDPFMTQGGPPAGGMQDGTPTGGVQLSQGPLKGELAAVFVLTTQGVGVFGMITVSAPERIVSCRQALFAPASVGCQQLALATVLCRRRDDDCAWSLGSISFRTRVNGLEVLACLTPPAPPTARAGKLFTTGIRWNKEIYYRISGSVY
jgi:hypothetical protein